MRELILGLVQGLTEFLPISSSAHLVLVPHFLGFEPPKLLEVTAYHIGTLVSVCWVMRRELIGLFYPHPRKMMLQCLFITTVVTSILGVVLSKLVGADFEQPKMVSLELVISGLLMFSVFLIPKREATPMNFKKAALIGVVQGIAAFPGISRSATTLVASFWSRINRQFAVEYSFLASVPVIFGAFIYELLSHGGLPTVDQPLGPVVLGVLVSTVSGAASLAWFLKFLKSKTLLPFAIYCVLIGSLAYVAIDRGGG